MWIESLLSKKNCVEKADDIKAIKFVFNSTRPNSAHLLKKFMF